MLLQQALCQYCDSSFKPHDARPVKTLWLQAYEMSDAVIDLVSCAADAVQNLEALQCNTPCQQALRSIAGQR